MALTFEPAALRVMSVPQPPSKLWEQAVAEYIAQLNITDAEAIKQGASNPDKFIQALKISGNSPKNDHVSRSLEKLLSAAMLVSGAVPDFMSVVWCSVELLYNVSHCGSARNKPETTHRRQKTENNRKMLTNCEISEIPTARQHSQYYRGGFYRTR